MVLNYRHIQQAASPRLVLGVASIYYERERLSDMKGGESCRLT